MRFIELFEGINDDNIKKYNITKCGPGSTGFDEEKEIWYGWSHRAVVGFKIGDKIFEPDFGDDDTLFSEHGKRYQDIRRCKVISNSIFQICFIITWGCRIGRTLRWQCGWLGAVPSCSTKHMPSKHKWRCS